MKHGTDIALLAALFAALLGSCTRSVDFDGSLPEPKLAVNCFVEPDSLIRVFVSRSWHIGEAGGEAFADATVELYINDVRQPPMQVVDAGTELYPSYVSPSVARAGDRVRLTVAREGYGEVTAETAVPHGAPVLGVDTVRGGERSLRCFVRLKDVEPGTRSYYRLEVWQEVMHGGEPALRSVRYDYDREPALMAEFDGGNDDFMGNTSRLNTYGIFGDDLFDGREYALNIGVETDGYRDYGPAGEADGDARGDCFVFRLVTLSPSAYLYLKSLTLYERNSDGGDFFAEPTPVYSNVAGGLGILGGCHTATARVCVDR
ncbi:MAG: DUF4249 domain-containing protein [Tannerella sp.]|nr:DUF4249 domain-containing protein [Tannerella sp.]